MGGLAYLAWWSAANRVRVRLRRLREPRYAVGAAVGLFYLYAFVFRPGGRRGRGGVGLASLLAAHHVPVEAIGGALLLLVALLAWALPSSARPALAFSRADVQFLFPAPLTRRQLVRYRVMRSQLGATLGSAFVTLVFRPGTIAAGWSFFAGVLILMAAINLYFTGVSLRRQSLAEHGIFGLARQWIPIAIGLGAIGVVGAAIARDWPSLAAIPTFPREVTELARVLTSGAAGAVLAPFRALVRLPIAATPAAFLATLPTGAIVLALTYFWIERSDTAFEETSAAFAETRAASDPRGRRIAPRVRASTAPFTLGLTGRAEIALLWKNLLLLGRYASLKVLLRLVPAVIALGAIASASARTHGLASAMTITCLVIAAAACVLGPQIVRNDLRRDLANLDVIRTWPLSGAAVVRGEVLAPAAVLTAIVWLLVVCAACASIRAPELHVSVPRRVDIAAAVCLVAPGLILAQIIVHNAIAIAFPAWAQIGARTRGVEVTGQRLLMLAGLLLVLVVALLPAVLAGGVVALAIRPFLPAIPVIIPAAAGAVVLVIECAVAAEGTGRLLDRTDVGAIDAVE